MQSFCTLEPRLRGAPFPANGASSRCPMSFHCATSTCCRSNSKIASFETDSIMPPTLLRETTTCTSKLVSESTATSAATALKQSHRPPGPAWRESHIVGRGAGPVLWVTTAILVGADVGCPRSAQGRTRTDTQNTASTRTAGSPIGGYVRRIPGPLVFADPRIWPGSSQRAEYLYDAAALQERALWPAAAVP